MPKTSTVRLWRPLGGSRELLLMTFMTVHAREGLWEASFDDIYDISGP